MGNVVFDSCGTSIFEEMSRLAMQVDAVNLGQGFPEELEPKEVVEAAMRALRDGPHQYPPMLGLPALRQAVAQNARRFLGLEVDWEREVLVTSGATEALADAFFGLLNTGDEVILIEPAYDSYPVIIRRAGAVPVPVRLRPPKWELPRDALEAAITPRTKAIVINTPMNPIGKIFGDDDLRFIADLLIKHDLLAIADEVYEHLVFDGRRHKSLFALPDVRDRVVRIGSAGKTFSVTGWKVGYVTADARLIAPIARAHRLRHLHHAARLAERRRLWARPARLVFPRPSDRLAGAARFLVAGLRGVGFDVGEVDATYFAVAGASRFDVSGDDTEFCRRLTLQAGVTAVPISAFYSGRDVRSHIRFCFAKKRETLEAALARLTRWSARAGLRTAS